MAVEMALGIAGICMTFAPVPLPETQGEPLPQSLDDMKVMKAKTKREGCRLLKRKKKVDIIRTLKGEEEK